MKLHIGTQSILIRIGVLFAIVCAMAGFNAWTAFEQKKSDDIATLAAMSQIRQSLHLYYVNHNQYPPSPSGEPMTVSQTLHCLSDTGFAPLSSGQCEKKDYLIRFKGRFGPYALIPTFIYQPQAADGSPCTSPRGCDSYSIPFAVETNALFSKGAHTMTPLGLP